MTTTKELQIKEENLLHLLLLQHWLHHQLVLTKAFLAITRLTMDYFLNW
jgi:hypothetical protein